ncbi:hypothetical protein FB45DRAFT_915524 [Roridomyces roridus]|uniref:Transposase n=1 Tax=Roridomyces roridus TaxID=1738132 RepID=A0AAD7FL51_9AGAR|nr:hypothetical protein FB45DRAFT_915524 [Roridomyces roridus]
MQPADDDESVPGVPLSAHAAPCPCDDCRVNPPDLLQMDPNSFASFLDTLDDSSSVHDDHGEGPDLLQMDPNSFASFLDTLNDSSPAHDDDGEASGVEESDSDNSWIFCKYRCSISNCPARYPALTRPCAGGVKAYLCIPCWAYLWMEQGFTVEQLKGALLPVTPELIRGFRKLLAKPLSEELVKRRLRFKSPKEGACSVPNCPITFPGACKRTQRLGNVIRDVCESCALVYWMQYLRDGEKHAPGSQDPRRKDPEIIRAWEEFVKQPLPEKYVELRHRSIQKPLLVLKSLDQSLAGEPVPCVGVDTCGVTDISKLVKVRARKLPGTTSHCLVCPPCSKRFQWFFYPATATTLARAAFNFANLPKPPGSTYTRLLVDNPAHHAFWIVVRTKLQGMWIRCPILQRFYTPTYGADHMFRTHVEHAHSGGEEWEFGDVVGTGFMRDVAVSARFVLFCVGWLLLDLKNSNYRGNLALIAADILAKTRSLGEAQKQYLAMVLPRGDGVIGEEVKHLNPNPDNDPYDIEGKDLFEDGGVPATVHELLTAPIEPWQTEAPLVQFRRLRKLPRDASKWPHLEHTLLPKFLHRFLHPDDSKIPIHHDHIDGYALDLPRKTPAVNPSYGGVEKEVRYVVKDEVDPIRFRELVKAESTWRVDSIFRYLHGMEPLLRKALDLYMADSGCQKVVAQTVANPEDFGLYGDLYRLVFGSADIAGALAEFFEDREVHCMTLQDYDDVVLTRPRDRGLRLKPRGGRFYGSRHRPEDVPADKRKRDEDEADEEDEDADEYNSDEEDEDEEQFENLWTPPEEDVVMWESDDEAD